MPHIDPRRRIASSLRGLYVLSALTGAIALAAGPVGAMPVPAPGNTHGLPAHVRELIRQDPTLFYPRKGFRPVIERQKAARLAQRQRLMRQGMSARQADAAAIQSITTVRYCPVLCGLYADKASPDWPVQDLVDELFSLDYGATNTLGQPGSMREHYRDMSYGTFDLQGGVFGWFPLPDSGSFYYSDDNGLGTDRTSGETGAFLEHTLEAADGSVDFRIYDNDGPDNIPNSGDDDGYADLVMFVHPNPGGECGGNDIWSHSFHYSGWPEHNGQPYTTNDIGANGQPIKIDDYVIMPAQSCGGGRIEVGVFSHEFGHALGLPDLYDRTARDPAGLVTSGGMGLFCLMAAGSWGGDYAHPETPTQMCAWSKEELGWLTPQEIICDQSTALYTTETSPEAVKLWRGGDYSQNEWFLVENRQRKKWDRYLRGNGFLITHVDNNVTTQNDEPCPGGNPCPAGHYQVMVVEADNEWEMQTGAVPVNGPWFGEAEDFFSASTVADWDDLTAPSARDHTGMATGVSVHGISASADKMTATFSVSQTCGAVPVVALARTEIRGGCDFDSFLDAGEKVSLAVTLHNAPTAAPAAHVRGTLTSLTPEVTVVRGEADFPDLGRGKMGEAIVPFEIQASAAAACSTTAMLRLDVTADGDYTASQTFSIPVGLDSLFVPISPFADDIESGSEAGWHHYAYINEDDWSPNTNGNHTTGAVPGHSWFTAAPGTGKDVSLEPPPFIPSAGSVLTFWHRYDTEDNWDGCVLELSTDGGRTWEDVGHLSTPGYDDAVMVNPQSSISGRECWNGLSNGYPTFEQVTLAMATWAGQACRLRFRMATDLASTGTVVPGWNIDDYQITEAQILRERCEATPVCGGVETDPPVFAGLEAAVNPGTPGCDAVDLKWQAATDASGPLTYLIYASTETPVATTAPIASTPLLKYRVGGLTPNGTYHFLVRARDSQGNTDANTVERSVTLDCELPNLVLDAVELVETAGCDGDQHPDAGELLNLLVRVRNAGHTNAGAARAVLRSGSDRLLVADGTTGLGDLAMGHYEDRAFELKVPSDVACMTAVTLDLELVAAGGYTAHHTIDLVLESDQGVQSFDFADHMEGAEPNGFSHGAASGADDWRYVTDDAYSPTHAWFAADAASVKDASLISPPLYVSATSVLTFRHKYVLEETFDGAVLEISTDGGATWTDIGQSYNSSQDVRGPLFGSPFDPGRPFWSGTSNDWQLETVNLGAMTSPLDEPLYAGKVVLIRWRIGCDDTNTEGEPAVGWWIDDIELTDSGTLETTCDAASACNTVAVDDAPGTPRASLLAPAAPNPLSTQSLFRFEIAPADAGVVSLRIFDVSGRLVKTLASGYRPAGRHQVQWNRTDESGGRVPGGVYFVRLQTGSQRLGRKVIVSE